MSKKMIMPNGTAYCPIMNDTCIFTLTECKDCLVVEQFNAEIAADMEMDRILQEEAASQDSFINREEVDALHREYQDIDDDLPF